MRIAVLCSAASALVAGCSPVGGDRNVLVSAHDAAASVRRHRRRPPPATHVGGRAAPAAGRPDRRRHPVDRGRHACRSRRLPLGDSGRRDARTGRRVAFTTAGTETNCMTDSPADGALACLVSWPTRRHDRPTSTRQWKPTGWTSPAPPSTSVRPTAIPGRFIDGSGPELPRGQTLAFGDYRCRADPAACSASTTHTGRVKLGPARRRGLRVFAEDGAAGGHRPAVQLLSAGSCAG